MSVSSHLRYRFACTRLGMAWHVLRGWLLAYRLTVHGEIECGYGTTMRECVIHPPSVDGPVLAR